MGETVKREAKGDPAVFCSQMERWSEDKARLLSEATVV